MNWPAARIALSRLIGALVALEAVFLLVEFLKSGGPVYAGLGGYIGCAYGLLVLLLGIGALQAKYWARIILSILIPLQTIVLFALALLFTTAGHPTPVVNLIIPAVFCFVAAWVVYPGGAKRSHES